jgi:hypothetical protein
LEVVISSLLPKARAILSTPHAANGRPHLATHSIKWKTAHEQRLCSHRSAVVGFCIIISWATFKEFAEYGFAFHVGNKRGNTR